MISEAFSPFLSPGSVLFSKPSEVDQWCQSLPVHLPPTPDSSFDCALSDFCQDLSPEPSQDMNAPYDWSQASLSENMWATTSADGEEPSIACHADGFQSQGPTETLDLPASENSAWYPTTHGSVAGLSPVLSQMSQNSHSLNFFPELESFVPAGDQFSLPSEAIQWSSADPVTLFGPYLSQDAFLASMPPDAVAQVGQESRSVGAVSQQQSIVFTEAQSCDPQRSLSEPSASHGRRLLPRAQAPALTRSQSGSQFRVIQPQLSGESRAESQPMVGSLSAGPQTSAASCVVLDATSQVVLDPGHPSVPAHGLRLNPEMSETRSLAPAYFQIVPALPDPGYQYYGFSEHAVPHASSYARLYDVSHSVPLTVSSGNVQPGLLTAESGYRMNPAPFTPSTDADEGRYRLDPLYKVGPQADGLYHCFNEGNTQNPCAHKPTKLKCNYDKFIDSHLKPFRCKDKACSKQHFSSMACVLRHEREAHGLHGHGERPFPCQYAGCERALPHNGFPRKYNLCDHMKRVHGWKDESLDDQENGVGQRKGAGRKRKASNSSATEPAARKIKTSETT